MTYAGYTLPQPVGLYTFQLDGYSFRFTQDFFINDDDSGSDFNTAVLAAEAACNTANGALTITWESQSYRTLSPATNTALLTRGRLIKPGDRLDAQRSRKYTLEVTGLLPASEFRSDAQERGYFETMISMSVDAARRPSFSFRGQYRAEKNISAGAQGAIELYTDGTYGAKQQALDWLDSNAATFSGVTGDNTRYELIAEQSPVEDQDKHIQGYSLTYRYRIIPETAAGAASSDVIVENMTITQMRSRIGMLVSETRGGSGGQSTAPAQPAGTDIPLRFKIDFECSVNLEAGNDYDDIVVSIYEGVVRGFLQQHLTEVWAPPGGEPILMEESVPVVTDKNRLAVSWMMDVPNSRNFISLSYSLEEFVDDRKTHIKRADGKENTYDSYSPGIRLEATQQASGTVVNKGLSAANMNALIPPLDSSKWDRLDNRVRVSAWIVTDGAGNPVTIVDFTVIRRFLFREEGSSAPGQVPGGGAGAGNRPGGGQITAPLTRPA